MTGAPTTISNSSANSGERLGIPHCSQFIKKANDITAKKCSAKSDDSKCVRQVRSHSRRPPWAKVEKAGGAQLVDALQVGDAVQSKTDEEVRGRHPEEPPAGAGAPALGLHPAGFHQGVDRALAKPDPTDLLDLGAGHRLVIGDDAGRYSHSVEI